MRLEFNPDEHVYTVDDRAVPSVTQILRAVGLTGSYEFSSKIHAFRGHSVHSGAALIISGADEHPQLEPLEHPFSTYPEYVQVHSEIPGYWGAVRQAHKAIKFEGTIYECPMIDPVRGYAGTMDFGAYTNAHQLWDIKSGTYPIMTVVQICAYEDLARNGQAVDPNHPGLPWLLEFVKSGTPFQRCGLRVEKTGRWTAYYETHKGTPYSSPRWMSVWRSALWLHNNIPDHHYVFTDDYGKPHTKSRLSDLSWAEQQARDRLKDPLLTVALRAGENLWHIRSAYSLL